jgi:hypothetical protein
VSDDDDTIAKTVRVLGEEIIDKIAHEIAEPCLPSHRILAGHILHAVNLGYEEVTATHLRKRGIVWEAEIVLDPLGLSYVFRDECPLEAALTVAAEVVEVVEAQRERVSAGMVH